MTAGPWRPTPSKELRELLRNDYRERPRRAELEDHRAVRPDEIRSLNDEVGDLYLGGSGTLVRAMLPDGLIDELHFVRLPAHHPRVRSADSRRKPRPGTCRLRLRVLRERCRLSGPPTAGVVKSWVACKWVACKWVAW